MSDLECATDLRRHEVRRRQRNGLDYLEVGEDRRTLRAFFLGPAPPWLSPAHFRVEGGRRVRDIRVVGVQVRPSGHPDLDDHAVLVLDRPGDLSTYRLWLVGAAAEEIDPRYRALDFSFTVDCPTGLDCAPAQDCPTPPDVQPVLSYLAKDYASFRQLILDRLALLLPGWQERHVPDVGVALVELLAYAGDRLSYLQDAVATEAYLETARQRTSVRRHARLVDHRLHEGCNARAWVCLTTDGDVVLPADDVLFLTEPSGERRMPDRPLRPEDLADVPEADYEVFAPLPPVGDLRVRATHSRIAVHTWGQEECCLPRGATAATLRDGWADDYRQERLLDLAAGDVVVFEEVLGPVTGAAADADPAHRQAVRLTAVTPGLDDLLDLPVVAVEWAERDALSFPLCLSAVGGPDCTLLTDVSVARGNVVLVDHGRPRQEALEPVPVRLAPPRCPEGCCPQDEQPRLGRYRPRLDDAPLTFATPPQPQAPASALLVGDPPSALPALLVTAGDLRWEPRLDLLASGADDRHVVAEVDDAGRATLRFGSGGLGRAPDPGPELVAGYRTGNGPDGNVGAGAITRLLVHRTRLEGLTVGVRNPLPATGGTAPESRAEALWVAPHAFRRDQERAVTAEDYARLAERHPAVQRAATVLRWTGARQEMLVAIDPAGLEEAGDALLEEVAGDLSRVRRIGHDLVVAGAQRVPLDVALLVCVDPSSVRGHVRAALLDRLGPRRLPDGTLGLFAPDALTFGGQVRLSALVAAAHGVSGVLRVDVLRFRRFGEPDRGEIERGVLALGPLEIARLDNDPSEPEHGRLRLTLRGGR